MFLNIDYAKRAAIRETKQSNTESLVITSIEDDDIDYEQLFDDNDITITKNISQSEIKKPIKRVRFDPIVYENSLTPTLSRSSSIRPTFEIEFDFDSLISSSNELNKEYTNITEKSIENINWKDAFLSDLQTAKKNQSTISSSPSIIQIENKTNNDTLWDFMKESNPELLEKLEKSNNDKQKRVEKFSIQQSTSTNKTNIKFNKSIPIQDKEGI